jgi:O-glycosyl hydrolase
MATVFIGPLGVEIYRAITLKHALHAWNKSKIRMARAWTPLAMMKAAGQITGQKFKTRDYAGAVAALEDWLEKSKAEAIRTGAVQ